MDTFSRHILMTPVCAYPNMAASCHSSGASVHSSAAVMAALQPIMSSCKPSGVDASFFHGTDMPGSNGSAGADDVSRHLLLDPSVCSRDDELDEADGMSVGSPFICHGLGSRRAKKARVRPAEDPVVGARPVASAAAIAEAAMTVTVAETGEEGKATHAILIS